MASPSVYPTPFVIPPPAPVEVSPFCPPADYTTEVSPTTIDVPTATVTPSTSANVNGLQTLEAILNGTGLGSSTPKYRDRI